MHLLGEFVAQLLLESSCIDELHIRDVVKVGPGEEGLWESCLVVDLIKPGRERSRANNKVQRRS